MKYFNLLKRILEFLYVYLIVLIIFLRNKLKSGEFFFAQVGANDGKSGDPFFYIIKFLNWKGIMFEPVPYVFEKLKNNYQDNKNIILENSALTSSIEKLNFYFLKKSNNPNLPDWYDQIGSFNLSVLEKHKKAIPDFENLLTHTEVKTTNFNKVIEKYKIKNIDLVFIDTEGYDYEVVKMIPFNLINPSMILFEHKHLSNKDLKDSLKLLSSLGYKNFKTRDDYLFFK